MSPRDIAVERDVGDGRVGGGDPGFAGQFRIDQLQDGVGAAQHLFGVDRAAEQDGDPRGDGNGGPGWSIRCEVNMADYSRGAVGMALSGKDTGGSQWFVTHSPQPHLDGGYTVFGRVNETGMKVVDKIVRGDKILSVRIVESAGGVRTR